MEQSVRVLMLDDHLLSRRGLEIVLGAADGIDMIGGFDADTGDHLVIDLRPDVVLVGGGRHDPAADATCTRLRAAVPQARIVVMNRAGTRSGRADGCLARDSSIDDVTGEIMRVAQRS